MPESSSESKFKDPELLRWVREQLSTPITVLVELDLPSKRVEYEEVNRFGVKTKLPKSVEPPTPKEREEIEQRTEQAQRFLNDSLGTEPTWLQSSRTFIVAANGRQLSSIASSPLIKAIYLNRTLTQLDKDPT